MTPDKPDMYDELAELYDLFIDWPKRLAAELPLLDELGVGLPGQRLIDAACGTGHHARAWARRECDVLALDASSEMIGRAREIDPGLDIDWQVGGFTEVPADGSADAVVCLGTSLPHVATPEGYEAALAAWSKALKPGGRLVAHSRNLPKVLAGEERFLSVLPRERSGDVVLFWRFYDIIPPEHVDFHLAIFDEARDWSHTVLTSRLCVVGAERLSAMARKAGLKDVQILGHLDGRAYAFDSSPDLVLVASG